MALSSCIDEATSSAEAQVAFRPPGVLPDRVARAAHGPSAAPRPPAPQTRPVA